VGTAALSALRAARRQLRWLSALAGDDPLPGGEGRGRKGVSAARLLRLCNLIDRSKALVLLTSVNVRVFRWLGKDRRQPAHFYGGGQLRNGS